jgi:hypothetical protein
MTTTQLRHNRHHHSRKLLPRMMRLKVTVVVYFKNFPISIYPNNSILHVSKLPKSEQ